MLRYSLIPVLAASLMMIAPPSDAQRQADIVQGVTSGQLAATVEELRVSNAELRARMTGIESDKARLNGKVETLEFLLSESRDEINRMQSDDAELERLITRLETRLSEQADMIATLERQVVDLQPEPAFLSSVGGATTFAAPGVSEAGADGSGDAVIDPAGADVIVGAESAGPTRIIRRVESTPQVSAAAFSSVQMASLCHKVHSARFRQVRYQAMQDHYSPKQNLACCNLIMRVPKRRFALS